MMAVLALTGLLTGDARTPSWRTLMAREPRRPWYPAVSRAGCYTESYNGSMHIPSKWEP
jgi:hypothetical protein